MNEFSLIQKYFKQHKYSKNVVMGIGDDCAILELPKQSHLCVSIDTQLVNRHFPEQFPVNLLGARALHCAVSDLAAMSASPLWFTLALTLPNANPDWLASFSEGLFDAAHTYSIQLVGGDTTSGPLAITIQVHGVVDENKALLRSGAHEGDAILVSGYLGDAAAGLNVIQNKLIAKGANKQYLTNRFSTPYARIKEAQFIQSRATSCIDVSDGLLADLGHICDASELSARIVSSEIPLSESLLASVDQAQALTWALTGGDDYELCFTVPNEHYKAVINQGALLGFRFTKIGNTIPKMNKDIIDSETGQPFHFLNRGYQHF